MPLLGKAKIIEDLRPTVVTQQAKLCPGHFVESSLYSANIMSSWVVHVPCLSSCLSIQSAQVQGLLTNAAQPRNVRRTNTRVLKIPSSRSFHMLALAEHPLFCVCFSETFLHESALAFHTCVHFNKMFLHVLAQQNAVQPTFQRTLTFPLHIFYQFLDKAQVKPAQ